MIILKFLSILHHIENIMNSLGVEVEELLGLNFL